MKRDGIARSAIALVAAGSSAFADGASPLPAARVRSLGVRALSRARTGGLSFDDLDINPFLVPMMCMMFEMDEFKDSFAKEAAKEGMVCPRFGCDDPSADVPNLHIECRMEGEFCQEGLRRRLGDDEMFCVRNTEVEMSMGLNLSGVAPISSKQCSTYTRPQYMADMGRACWTVDAKMDFGALMGSNTHLMTEEEAFEASVDAIEINDCSGTFGDGTTCVCGFCNDKKGFELKCSNNLVSQECTNYEASISNLDTLANNDTESHSTLGISVIKLRALEDGDIIPGAGWHDKTSSGCIPFRSSATAAFNAFGVTAGLVLLFASLQAQL